MRSAYTGLAALTLLLVALQFLLAGLGIWGVIGFDAHEAIGYGALHLVPLLMVAAAVAGRLGRAFVVRAILLFVLVTIQAGLAGVGEDLPGLGALHPLFALVLFLVAHATFQRARATAA